MQRIFSFGLKILLQFCHGKLGRASRLQPFDLGFMYRKFGEELVKNNGT